MTTKLFIKSILRHAMVQKAVDISGLHCASIVEAEDIDIRQYKSAFGETVYETDGNYGVCVYDEHTEMNFIANASIDENGNVFACVLKA